MKTTQCPERLTDRQSGRNFRLTRSAAPLSDKLGEFVRIQLLLLTTRIACRRRPAIPTGVVMLRLQPCLCLPKVILACMVLGVLLFPRVAEAQDSPAVLTLDEAIHLAIANNRPLKIAMLDTEKSRWQVAEVKSKRLPSFSGTVLGSQLLNEVGFNFPAGAFGTIPGVGPFPSADTRVTTPRQPVAYVVGQAKQPLSQLYKIQLAVRAQELGGTIATEKARAERQNLVKDVKQAYYSVLQTESELEAAEANVKQYDELDRVVLQRVSQEAALQSASLEVKAKFANEKFKLLELQDTLESRKEYLNLLLGRDIRTEFRAEPLPATSFEEIDLKLAQGRALAQRTEIRQAELNMRQAEYDRRMAKADYIPDLGVAFNYASNFNVDVLPRNMTSIGFEIKWEPWDWGRRKDIVNQKKVTETQAHTQLYEAQSHVLIDVNNRFRKLHESRVMIAVAEAGRAAAQQKLREVTDEYRQESVLLSDVLRQQAAAAGASDDYQKALLSFWSAKSEFEKSLGEDQ